jgi:hypothetical protein
VISVCDMTQCNNTPQNVHLCHTVLSLSGTLHKNLEIGIFTEILLKKCDSIKVNYDGQFWWWFSGTHNLLGIGLLQPLLLLLALLYRLG